MSDISQARTALVKRILERDGKASPSERRGAFNNSTLPEPLGGLVDRVARHAYRVTDEDITAVGALGPTEDQVFEIAVCAAIGQATRQYDTALAALEAATGRNEHAASNPRQRPRPRYEGTFRGYPSGPAPTGARRRQAGQVPG